MIQDHDLVRRPANFAPLSPLGFLDRSAAVYPERIAIAYGARKTDYRTLYARCRRLASALSQRGIAKGAVVAALLPNVPAMVEAHYGVPMAGAVLNTLNVRLDADTIAFMLDHGGAVLLLTDPEFAPVVRAAVAKLGRPIEIIVVADPDARVSEPLEGQDYEALLAEGDPAFAWLPPDDEWDAISLNYTSGTTGNPKGVVYHHRGAYLNAVNNGTVWSLQHHPVYLWTLPMFHCNGWCFPWTIALYAGTQVCLRRIDAAAIYGAVADHGVTHLCGAPVIMGLLINAKPGDRRPLPGPVALMTAAAPPPAAVIEAMEEQGFGITHVYGLTEVYGPCVVCAWPPEWDTLPAAERARLKSRQGVRYHLQDAIMVADPATLEPVPADGATLGEVFMRGNITMKGYLNNPTATDEAFAGGWFHSGDLGVMHPDGYVELKDRSKDIIISGGENISTIEVEDVLYRHPAVLEAAVVARPDEKWGETPCAFVTLKEGAAADAGEILDFCRKHLAGFKVPKSVVFGSLPKTSTGKVQKFVLRERARGL